MKSLQGYSVSDWKQYCAEKTNSSNQVFLLLTSSVKNIKYLIMINNKLMLKIRLKVKVVVLHLKSMTSNSVITFKKVKISTESDLKFLK